MVLHGRVGMPDAASERQWELFVDRFDVSKEPNEAFRFGWAVEIDPYDASIQPKKRTALGRFKHEAVNLVVAPDGRIVVYSGDDERFEYVYKFVSTNAFNADDRAANMDLLDEGTLYVATFSEDGSGQWLPLTFGEGPLTAENGFNSQADVLINARGAADLLGATKMDRPEDIEHNPVNGKIYMVMTNNTERGTPDGDEGPTPSNPRPENQHGHIVEVTEDGDDVTSDIVHLGHLHALRRSQRRVHLLRGLPEGPGERHLLPGQHHVRHGRQPLDLDRRSAAHAGDQ